MSPPSKEAVELVRRIRTRWEVNTSYRRMRQHKRLTNSFMNKTRQSRKSFIHVISKVKVMSRSSRLPNVFDNREEAQQYLSKFKKDIWK
jgi:hypothetical protein